MAYTPIEGWLERRDDPKPDKAHTNPRCPRIVDEAEVTGPYVLALLTANFRKVVACKCAKRATDHATTARTRLPAEVSGGLPTLGGRR
jgi:hypothetical protein